MTVDDHCFSCEEPLNEEGVCKPCVDYQKNMMIDLFGTTDPSAIKAQIQQARWLKQEEEDLGITHPSDWQKYK